MVSLRRAVAEDQEWVGRLVQQNSKMLANMNGGTLFYRWLHGNNPREHMFVAFAEEGSGVGFIHFLERLDGTKVVYEMAVDKGQRRKGVGRALISCVGAPIMLKTNKGAESNLFYRGLGFVAVGEKTAKNGTEMIVYQRW